MVDFDSATGYARTAPVGVAEVRVLGADDLRKALDLNGQTGAYCGYGPGVRVDGVPADTQVKATVRDVLQRRPVTFTTCGKDSVVPLQAGRHNVDVLAGGGFVPTETTLTKAGFGDVSVTPVQSVDVWRPNPAELTARGAGRGRAVGADRRAELQRGLGGVRQQWPQAHADPRRGLAAGLGATGRPRAGGHRSLHAGPDVPWPACWSGCSVC